MSRLIQKVEARIWIRDMICTFTRGMRVLRIIHAYCICVYKRANGSFFPVSLPRHHVGFDVRRKIRRDPANANDVQRATRLGLTCSRGISLSQEYPFWSMMTYFFTSVSTSLAGYGKDGRGSLGVGKPLSGCSLFLSEQQYSVYTSLAE